MAGDVHDYDCFSSFLWSIPQNPGTDSKPIEIGIMNASPRSAVLAHPFGNLVRQLYKTDRRSLWHYDADGPSAE